MAFRLVIDPFYSQYHRLASKTIIMPLYHFLIQFYISSISRVVNWLGCHLLCPRLYFSLWIVHRNVSIILWYLLCSDIGSLLDTWTKSKRKWQNVEINEMQLCCSAGWIMCKSDENIFHLCRFLYASNSKEDVLTRITWI